MYVYQAVCVCFYSVLVFVVWAYAYIVCMYVDLCMFFLVWGQCRSLGLSHKDFVCVLGYILCVLRMSFICSLCDVY